MSLDPDYLKYDKRRYGMDHERYEWSMLTDRGPITWPGGARLAVWINLNIQFFPLNQSNKPFAPPGGMSTAYPDLRHFTLRDYGNRVGLFRCMAALQNYGLRSSFSINAAIAERNPALIERLAATGNEIICGSWHMDTIHHGDMPEAEEADLIERSLSTLRQATGQEVTGWLSPARSQSHNTPDILTANGVRYMCDWINDELPYTFNTSNGELTNLPLSYELDDQFIIQSNMHSEWDYADQIKDACDYLLKEADASGGGRLLALNVHPWLMGQPHRIGAFESVLEHIAAAPGTACCMPGELAAITR